jgi:hypothetical protein
MYLVGRVCFGKAQATNDAAWLPASSHLPNNHRPHCSDETRGGSAMDETICIDAVCMS